MVSKKVDHTRLDDLTDRLDTKKESILFVAVGYSHLQGPNNMLELLQAKGFTYEDIELLEEHPEAGIGLSP